LPANGHARLQWKQTRDVGEGKLFYSTTAAVETTVGAGLLSQQHVIEYRVLQGELDAVQLDLAGPGEILDVQGADVIAWTVDTAGDTRQLNVRLSRPITNVNELVVRSQTPLEAFPVRVEGLRLSPVGAIRHSGDLRISNRGSVRLEPTALQGLTQLAPDQFPGEPLKARQVFVYRFPSAEYAYALVADRIQPEVSIAQLVRYELTETDRVIRADIELDIREAPIREWDFDIPADYSVVSATGASVSDYSAATEEVDGRRILKIMFADDVAGRQLVSLHLEKNDPATPGEWMLPHIEFPEAKAVRGDIGISSTAGFRISVNQANLLVEKPVSYFPKASANLQQAFRIRDIGWSATMTIERLERSVQADVFHLYSLSEDMVYGSTLINYFVTGAPVSELRVSAPAALGNVLVDGKDVRTWRREGDLLLITLHQPVMGAYTLLITFEEKANATQRSFSAGTVEPLDVSSERGYVQVVSPRQVEMTTLNASDGLLKLEPLELPAEFRLLSTAPALGTWQYTERPFTLNLQVNWFTPGNTIPQVVEYSEANSRVSRDGELVTDVLYYVKSRGQTALRVDMPPEPTRLWEATVNGQPITVRQSDSGMLIPLPGGLDPNVPIEVRLRLGKPSVDPDHPALTLPVIHSPVLKTQWNIQGDEQRVLIPQENGMQASMPVLRQSGFTWLTQHGLVQLIAFAVLVVVGVRANRTAGWRSLGVVMLLGSVILAIVAANQAYASLTSTPPLEISLPILAEGQVVELHVANVPAWQVNWSGPGIAILCLGILLIGASLLTRSP
ncbi:MAG: hypothetical protein KDB23_27005, partial [Planctomycetales bacterium]|nr:hypothetical protein [Planctomycetales bacterium]